MFRTRRFASVAVRTGSRGAAYWQKLVSPWADKAYVQGLAAQIARMDTITQEASAVKPVAPIDWAHWEKTIRAPGVVAQLKKEYESHKFTPITYDHCQSAIAHNQKLIDDAKAILPHTHNELKVATQKVAELKHIWNHEFKDWGYEDMLGWMPGVHQQLIAQYDEDNWMSGEEEDAFDETLTMELPNLIKQARAGQLPTSTVNVPAAFRQIGDMNMDEEIELMRVNEWSIERWNKCKEERAEIHKETLALLGRKESLAKWTPPVPEPEWDVNSDPWEGYPDHVYPTH